MVRRESVWAACAVCAAVAGWSGAGFAQAPGLEIEELGAAPVAAKREAPRAAQTSAPAPKLQKIVTGAYMAAVSADGETIVAGERHRLRVVSAAGERILRKAKHINYNGLQISADGALVHHRDGDGGVWLYDAATGRVLAQAEATRSTLTPAGELLWWEDNSALARESYVARSTFAPAPDAQPPQARPGSCQLHRRGVDGRTQRLWLSECRDVLMVSADGSFAVIGQGGGAERYTIYAGTTMPQDHFARLVRVDLATGEREVLGGADLVRPQLSADGRTVCGSPRASFASTQRELVRCERAGQAPIELSLPTDPARPTRWTWLHVSPDGRWLAAASAPEEAHRGELTSATAMTHVLPIEQDAQPVFSAPGSLSEAAWLPGGQRVALSTARPTTYHTYIVDVAAGWTAQLDQPGRLDEIGNILPIGTSAQELIVLRGRGEGKSGADVWRVRL